MPIALKNAGFSGATQSVHAVIEHLSAVIRSPLEEEARRAYPEEVQAIAEFYPASFSNNLPRSRRLNEFDHPDGVPPQCSIFSGPPDTQYDAIEIPAGE